MTMSHGQSQERSRTLRQKMASAGLVRIMATHSPLSARLAEEAGFDGLWASGFELSALYGLADVSLISMTQHLDMVRAIAEQSRLPLVADLDTGFGNAINVIHAVEQYQRAGAAAVVIEDKTFPKVTSLAADGRQELVRIAEFQGKIEAAVAARSGFSDHRPHRSAYRRLGPSRGADARRGLCRSRRRHDPRSFQAKKPGRDR
jgi:phosphoenolpyruvate phosphomutase